MRSPSFDALPSSITLRCVARAREGAASLPCNAFGTATPGRGASEWTAAFASSIRSVKDVAPDPRHTHGGSAARGHPRGASVRALRQQRTNRSLVWDRRGLGEKLRREWLSGQGVVDAQLDAYVSGAGEWATGGDDEDDYEDACATETWRDGGVLSEADA